MTLSKLTKAISTAKDRSVLSDSSKRSREILEIASHGRAWLQDDECRIACFRRPNPRGKRDGSGSLITVKFALLSVTILDKISTLTRQSRQHSAAVSPSLLFSVDCSSRWFGKRFAFINRDSFH